MAKTVSSKVNGAKKKPETSPPRNAICPRCHTMLTRADRIPKTTLQAIFSPSKKRYWCDACGLKFTTSGTVSASGGTQATDNGHKKQTSSRRGEIKETHPSQKETQAIKRKNGVAHSRQQATKQQPSSQTITSEARHPTEQAKPASNSAAQEILLKELARLRKVEKKYRALKKVNRYLLKATRRRANQSQPRR